MVKKVKIMIRKFVLVIGITSLLILSCEREGPPPAIDAPKGMKQLITRLDTRNCYCEYYVDRYSWHADTVYLLSCRGRPGRQESMADECDCMQSVYNKSGVLMSRDSTFPLKQVLQEIRFINHVWICTPQ